MPLTAADLTVPTGKMQEEWFGDEDLPGYLTLWLSQGYAAAADVADADTRDGIARAYAYWQGYESRAGAKAGQPSSASVDDLSVSIGRERLAWFDAKAAEWRLTYENALAAALAVEPEPVPAISPAVSMSLPLRVSF